MPTVHVNGIDIYYEIHGSGEPLVMIAGLGYGIWVWHKMLPDLAENNQVIIFDNRGVGKTDDPPGPYTADMMADDTVELIKALGFDKTAILGHSMGGFIAQSLILAYPQIVNKLILASTDFGGPNHVHMPAETIAILTDTKMELVERSQWGIKISTSQGFYEANPEFVQEWIDYIISRPMTLEALQAQMAIGLGLYTVTVEDSYELKLKQIEVPTLILSGDDDKLVPPGNVDLLAREIPNSQIEIITDCGHFFPFDKPDAAVEAINSFLHA
jgi:pimeloyl-ACP methyl ester carboxylesterase